MIGADSIVGHLSDQKQALHATQRYSRGWSDIDMWNFDCFLADAIVAACDWHLSGAAQTTLPMRFGDTTWVDELTEIKEGFSARNDAGLPDPPQEAWELLIKHFSDFWD